MTKPNAVEEAWNKLREPFVQVWQGKADRVDVKDLGAKVYRVGSKVRIDIEVGTL